MHIYIDYYSYSWAYLFEELLEFREKNGHCMVPGGYPSNEPLGKWVLTQRKEYRKKQLGRKSSLTNEREAALDAIGFVWNAQAFWNERFEERFEDLILFHQDYGHCMVPFHYPTNKPLGNWVHNQRIAYKLKQQGEKSPLTNEQEAELDEIGFVWKMRAF